LFDRAVRSFLVLVSTPSLAFSARILGIEAFRSDVHVEGLDERIVGRLSYLHFHAGVPNHQIVCFLRIAEAAALGRLVVGRKGKETRFELDVEEAATFLRAAGADRRTERPDSEAARAPTGFAFSIRRSPRVFITCGAAERERAEIATTPLLSSLMERMRGCDTAIVQIDANVVPREAEPRIPADVLIEIGTAMALSGAQFRFAGRGLGSAAAESTGAL
jgi:hypothetical protein